MVFFAGLRFFEKKILTGIFFFSLDDVMWNGDKIVVMGVTIEPPYRPESIKAREDNGKAREHIRKIVSIYFA